VPIGEVAENLPKTASVGATGQTGCRPQQVPAERSEDVEVRMVVQTKHKTRAVGGVPFKRNLDTVQPGRFAKIMAAAICREGEDVVAGEVPPSVEVKRVRCVSTANVVGRGRWRRRNVHPFVRLHLLGLQDGFIVLDLAVRLRL
jgi:hypothetical protein